MPDPIRLVTENAGMAFWTALRCTPYDAPAWVSAISSPLDIMALPDGVKCLGLWFSPRKYRSEAEQAWIARRLMGGILAIDDADWARIKAFETRDAQQDREEREMPVPAAPAMRPPGQKIGDLVQSQRWI